MSHHVHGGKAIGAAAIAAARMVVSRTGLTPGGHQRVLRCGAIAIKKGMSMFWDHHGALHPLTILQIQQCHVIQQKVPEIDGYLALQVGSIDKKPNRAMRAETMHAAKAGVAPKRHMQEFYVTPNALLAPGTEITASHFRPGQYVDVTGISIGKGFQGGMKRHGFKGQPATHGVSRAHRSIGSIGMRKTPGRVWKGKKMPGRMGGDKITVLGLRVVSVDHVNGLIAVRGAVPGSKEKAVRVRDAIRMKHHLHNETLDLPVPTRIFGEGDAKESPPLPEVEWTSTEEWPNIFMPPEGT
eukprot:CAMPEP_0173379638 /NCGR_PEP_ID=MMETSP1356-20130122/2498_1 /TAXON_ID=77927 ORGANISM="Hemiselmis virescens, Strain PCC157" /NCGR_SAMPLE_ID=MMETSP1356 /ASSEMBLY_ACC=CAM_ASM_000847 /LENGTH=296 /DNA_ID=CAMNT_0014333001 /DNA_START=22 /DNA_END=912 /DNA_ORIENTATION=+